MPELRCKACNKLLAKGYGALQIKCARCRSINIFNNLERRECHNHEDSRHETIPQRATPVYRAKTQVS